MGRRYEIGGCIKPAVLLQRAEGSLTGSTYSAWQGAEGDLMVTGQLPSLIDELHVNLQKPKPVTHRTSITSLLSSMGCRTPILWLVALCFKPAFAADSAKASTHCKPEEKVIFSCPFRNGKTVSLCASPDLSKDNRHRVTDMECRFENSINNMWQFEGLSIRQAVLPQV